MRIGVCEGEVHNCKYSLKTNLVKGVAPRRILIKKKLFYYFLSFRPDLAALQARGAIPGTGIPSAIPPPLAAFTGPNLEDLEAPRRQTSMDGEQIKIVIHDVDSGPICSSKRRIVLRRDPSDKAHRSEYCNKSFVIFYCKERIFFI